MEINFYKYHGLGNDFIIVDAFKEEFDYSSFAKNITNRNTGVGADGLIVVLKEPLTMLFYNQDGSLGTMCGNGLRCFSKYVLDMGFIQKQKFTVVTSAGLFNVEKIDNLIKIEFKDVSLEPKLMDINTTKNVFLEEKVLNSICYAAYSGTSHLVVFVDEFDSITESYAKSLHKHPIFKSKINVNFVQILTRSQLRIKTYERGVGFTLACGSGAIASFKICRLLGVVDELVVVGYDIGDLILEEKNNIFYFTGPAIKIARGTYFYNIK